MLGFGCAESWSVNLRKIWVFLKIRFIVLMSSTLLPHQQQGDMSPGRDDSAPWQPQEAAPHFCFLHGLSFSIPHWISPIKMYTAFWVIPEPHFRFSIFFVSLFLGTWKWSLSQLVLDLEKYYLDIISIYHCSLSI